jgi:hypothetical protein
MLSEQLREFAIGRDIEFLDAIQSEGSQKKAAKRLGVTKGVIAGAMFRLQRRAARGGHAPGHWDAGVAPGYLMGKVTVHRNGDGSIRETWERQLPDPAEIEAALAELREGFTSTLPKAPKVQAPEKVLEDLCTMYSYFDYHIGALCWHREGGDNWDLEIAEEKLNASYKALLSQSPKSKKAVVVVGGDWLHTDGLLPLTPAHKNVLDADGRYSKIVKVAIRGVRFLVREALTRHQEVELVVMEGNHDEAGSVWLRHSFAMHYEDEPRVTVNDSELPYYVVQWGETMLGFHHGHKIKNEQLPLLFAAQFPKVWGNTTKRAVHCGHRHHVDEKEYNGVTVVQHPTLSARDAHAARGGWIADRCVQAITYHRTYGQVGRVYVSPEMLGD